MKPFEEAKKLAECLVKNTTNNPETKKELDKIYQKLTQDKKMELIDYIMQLRE